MDIELLRNYCLAKPYTTEETPFGPQILVFKVYGKLFCLFNIETFDRVNLKCNPEYALALRSEYMGITQGFHMNKKHWNTITFDEDVAPEMILHLVDHSFDSVVSKLSKIKQQKIAT